MPDKYKAMAKFEKSVSKSEAADRDDTGYISPYRRRLQARAAAANALDSQSKTKIMPGIAGAFDRTSRTQASGQEARRQLAEIHSRSKKKDGGKR